MKQRVVFLFYHGLSHIIAVLKVARILESADYDVYFAGVDFFRPYVSSLGFKFKGLKSVPFGLGFESWVRTIEKEKYIYLSALRDRITDRIYTEREVELFWMLEELHPDFVFIDSRQATDFIVLFRQLKDRKIKVAITSAMLPATVGAGHPPLNSEVFPNDPVAIAQAIRLMRWNQFKTVWKEKLIHFGFDDQFIIKRRLKKNRIPDHYISKSPSLLNFSVENVDEFILAPREFDFPNSLNEPRQHYAGFMTNEIYDNKAETNYAQLWPTISQLKHNDNLNLVFCSFGTIEPKNINVILLFLKKLIQVSLRKTYILIIALKAKQEDIAELGITSNVYLFNFVPQLEVLKHTDVFITHGGLNSIREGVHAEVPMLLYPIHTEYDPIGNAARIAYHRLGLRGNAITDTEEEIDEKIKELLSNPVYKKCIQELKYRDSQYTAESFLQKLNSIKPLSI